MGATAENKAELSLTSSCIKEMTKLWQPSTQTLPCMPYFKAKQKSIARSNHIKLDLLKYLQKILKNCDQVLYLELSLEFEDIYLL